MKIPFHHKLIRPAAVLSAVAWVCSIQLPANAAETPNAPTVLTGGANAKSSRVDNMHKTRFIEIFLAHRDAKTGPGMSNYKP